jgi:hypothetical protein
MAGLGPRVGRIRLRSFLSAASPETRSHLLPSCPGCESTNSESPSLLRSTDRRTLMVPSSRAKSVACCRCKSIRNVLGQHLALDIARARIRDTAPATQGIGRELGTLSMRRTGPVAAGLDALEDTDCVTGVDGSVDLNGQGQFGEL